MFVQLRLVLLLDADGTTRTQDGRVGLGPAEPDADAAEVILRTCVVAAALGGTGERRRLRVLRADTKYSFDYRGLHYYELARARRERRAGRKARV